jgi:hypothetical protein
MAVLLFALLVERVLLAFVAILHDLEAGFQFRRPFDFIVTGQAFLTDQHYFVFHLINSLALLNVSK